MARCRRCGRCLTWPKSLSRGYGPVCWGKINLAQASLINYSPPEDLEIERGVLVKLHKIKNVIIASTSSKNIRRRERYYRKQGYNRIKDYSYHSYLNMFSKIQANPASQFVTICYDELSAKKRDGKNTTNMTISLMEKSPTFEIAPVRPEHPQCRSSVLSYLE